MHYADFSDLKYVYLEDSYVLNIVETPDKIAFNLDAVLMYGHARYRDPYPGEQYCYVKATLTLNDVTEIRWLTRSSKIYSDISGEQDLGNIDRFSLVGDHYGISGDWGHVIVYTSAEPRLTIE